MASLVPGVGGDVPFDAPPPLSIGDPCQLVTAGHVSILLQVDVSMGVQVVEDGVSCAVWSDDERVRVGWSLEPGLTVAQQFTGLSGRTEEVDGLEVTVFDDYPEAGAVTAAVEFGGALGLLEVSRLGGLTDADQTAVVQLAGVLGARS